MESILERPGRNAMAQGELSLCLPCSRTHCRVPRGLQQSRRAQDVCEDQPVSFDYQQMEDACKREIIN